MTENQKAQNSQVNSQSNPGQINQSKENNPAKKKAVTETEKVKPQPEEEIMEQPDRKHPHENSVPVGNSNKTKESL